MNFTASYYDFDRLDSLKNDSIGPLIQGLRIAFEEHGHTTAWSVHGNTASGNPLMANRNIAKWHQTHRIHLSRLGVSSLKAKPLTAAIVCEHTPRFWCNGTDEDTLLDEIYVVRPNLSELIEFRLIRTTRIGFNL